MRGSTTEKFHDWTGVTPAPAAAITSWMGGSTPADSPFLRRPDLLKSFVLYWQRHPSLSYLFSGLFIGPTSQAPRIDEARHDGLYELEIALGHVPKPGRDVSTVARRPFVPQHPDRRLRQYAPRRDLHRQALFARQPDRAPGADRVSLLRDAARRAHEPRPAAPAARLRRLVLARAAGGHLHALGDGAARPLHAAALRVGDFCGVLADLGRAGYAFEPSWFAAQFEFRFPPVGTALAGGAQMEIRQALEPWHVLGESGSAGGTVCATSIPRWNDCRSRSTASCPAATSSPATGDACR